MNIHFNYSKDRESKHSKYSLRPQCRLSFYLIRLSQYKKQFTTIPKSFMPILQEAGYTIFIHDLKENKVIKLEPKEPILYETYRKKNL